MDTVIFGYQLAEIKKTVVAFAISVLAVIGFFIAFPDAHFEDSVVICLGAIFNVIGVFAAENSSPGDYTKAVQAASASVVTLIGYFATVNPGTVETIIGLVLAVANVLFVKSARNRTIPANPRTAKARV